MKVRLSRFLRGPNVWAAVRIFELTLEAGVSNRDAQTLVDELRNLQNIAGTPVQFRAVRETSGVLLAAIEYVHETVVQGALEIALRLLASDSRTPTDADVGRLRDLAYQQSLPPSIATVADACKRRGVPAGLLSQEYGRYLWMGHGSKQHRMLGSEPDTVSGVARMASTDKYLTKQLLELAGIPVPRGKLASSVDEAFAAADALGYPLAMKPYDSDLQTGVTLDIRSRDQIEPAYRHAGEHSAWVMIEQFAPGTEHRVVVVGDKISAVTQVEPPLVVGDGVSTIAQLVAEVNHDPRRKGDERNNAPLTPVKLDDIALGEPQRRGGTGRWTRSPRRGERCWSADSRRTSRTAAGSSTGPTRFIRRSPAMRLRGRPDDADSRLPVSMSWPSTSPGRSKNREA